MTFNIEHKAWFTYTVEAETLDDAIEKAKTKLEPLEDKIAEIDKDVSLYTELCFASWETNDGKYYDKMFD